MEGKFVSVASLQILRGILKNVRSGKVTGELCAHFEEILRQIDRGATEDARPSDAAPPAVDKMTVTFAASTPEWTVSLVDDGVHCFVADADGTFNLEPRVAASFAKAVSMAAQCINARKRGW